MDSGGWELGYLPYDSRNEAGVRALLDNWPSEADDTPPDIPTPENTTALEALKEAIGNYVLDDDAEFPRGHEFEYFAVLALWLVADAIKWLGWTSDPKAMTSKLNELIKPKTPEIFPDLNEAFNEAVATFQGRGTPEFVDSYQNFMQAYGLSDASIQFSGAGESALCAMDAVCYAEHLHATKAQATDLVNCDSKSIKRPRTLMPCARDGKSKDFRCREQGSDQAACGKPRDEGASVCMVCGTYARVSKYGRSCGSCCGKTRPVSQDGRSWIGDYRSEGQSARKP